MKKSIYVLGAITIFIVSVILSLAEGNSEEHDLIFSHKLHIEDVGAECSACHEDAESSTIGSDDLLPKEETCMTCHDKEEMECTTCHLSGENPVLMPRIKDYSPKFNHAKHIEEGYQCMDCHSGISRSEKPGDSHLPTMTKCMSCHETPEEIDGCFLCHNKNETLLPEDHTDLWKTNHGSFSASVGNQCATCHTETFCSECHLGENIFNERHPPEFIMTHSMSFMMRESDCESCHTGYDYCRECHMELNYVRPVDHAMDWIQRHKTEAKTKVDACIVCHTQSDMTCMRCH